MGLAENEESGAPFLHDIESDVPLEIEVNATWDHSSGWHDLEVTRVALAADEARARASRPTAAEVLETDRLLDIVAEEERKVRGDARNLWKGPSRLLGRYSAKVPRVGERRLISFSLSFGDSAGDLAPGLGAA